MDEREPPDDEIYDGLTQRIDRLLVCLMELGVARTLIYRNLKRTGGTEH